MSAISGADRSCLSARRASGFNPRKSASILLANPFDALLGNRRSSVAGNLHTLATSVCPTIGEPDVRANAVRCDQPVVSGVAIHLQNA